MPLIDGKFEIINQRELIPGQTLISATAPDGSAVRIVWFDLPADEEAAFEKYRKLLKRLKRTDQAALYDLVSRPGAHYVVWRSPNGARQVEPDTELAQALSEAGYPAESADVRRVNGKPQLFDLAFGAELPAITRQASEEQPLRARRAEPPDWLVTITATTLLLVVAAALLWAGWTLRRNEGIVTVPQLQGEGVNSAAQALADLGLEALPVPVASNRSAGQVLETDPPAGSELRPGRSVRIAYALPPGSVTPAEVPRLVTLTHPREVEESLEEAGLALGAVSTIPADQPAGLVISQVPEAGTRVGEGSSVDVLVSAGPTGQATFVPDLVGLPVEEARYLARLAGLTPDRILEDEVPAERSEPGTVVSQSLQPYQQVSRSDAVLRLLVAGSGGVARGSSDSLPSFVGMTLGRALELANDLAMDVSLVDMSERSLPEGVVDQSPSAGTEPGAELTLFVNLHPVPIPRPEITARVATSEPREIPFRWFIEPGIPAQRARVYATTLQGERHLVLTEEVEGGEWLEGSWRTNEPGPVRFGLTLNGQPYGGEQSAR